MPEGDSVAEKSVQVVRDERDDGGADSRGTDERGGYGLLGALAFVAGVFDGSALFVDGSVLGGEVFVNDRFRSVLGLGVAGAGPEVHHQRTLQLLP